MDYKKLVKVADSTTDEALEWAVDYLNGNGRKLNLDRCVKELYKMTYNASDVELATLAEAIYDLRSFTMNSIK